MRNRITGAVAALACAWAMPAQAQMVTASNPSSVLAALKADGLEGKIVETSDEDPKIESSLPDTDTVFDVLFYDCTDHKNCRAIQLSSAYDFDAGADVLAAWNKDYRYARAYVDEDGAVLEMDLLLSSGGISRALFHDNLENWKRLVGAFETEIGRFD